MRHIDANDATASAGLVLLALGCGWAWPPLGLIVPGLILFGLSVWGTLRKQAHLQAHPQANPLPDSQPEASQP